MKIAGEEVSKLTTELKNWLFIVSGVVVTTIGINGFILNRGLIDGGITGISLLVSYISHWHVSGLILLVNLPLTLLGIKMVGKKFVFRSIIAVFLLSVSLYLFEIPLVTKDVWLISVFGGFFTGVGMGLVMRGDAMIDARELISMYLSRRHVLSASDVSLLLNMIIFIVAASYLGIETALYSILTFFTTNKSIDYITDGIEEYVSVNIVSEQHTEIRDMIVIKLGRGVTIFYGKMGHGKRGQYITDTEILMTIITRLELPKLQQEIEKIDKNAFVTVHSVRDTRGGIIKKRKFIEK